MFKYALLATALISNAWADNIEVWGTPVSPYVRKVLSVLEEKELDYTLHPILPKVFLEATHQPVPKEFEEISPFGKIPVVVIDSFSIIDSAVITAYLERKYPDHPLYPSNGEAYAKALWFEKYADTVMSDVLHQLLLENFVKPFVLKKPVDEVRISELMEKVPAILTYLERELGNNAYLAGDSLTIGDIAVIHHFISLQIAKIDLPFEAYPKLKSYVERTQSHKAIQAVIKKM